MAGEADAAAEKLRAYLRALKPGARALLIAELERGLLHGTSPAGAELVLAELRRSLREGSTTSPRIDDSARLFFQTIEPFLVDDGPDHKHRGRIARSAIEPLWLWIGNMLAPEEAKDYSAQVEQALTAGDTSLAEQQARRFQDIVAGRIGEMLVSADDRERRRLTVQLGTSRALEDVQVLRGILHSRDVLGLLAAQLPGHINSLAGPVMESVKAAVDSTTAGDPDLLLYSLILVMGRLASPSHLIRLATKAAASDQAKRVAETPYSVAVQIVLEEVDRRVRELATDLKSGGGSRLGAAQGGSCRTPRITLRDRHDSEIGMGQTACRHAAEVSKVLTAEIELMPGRVRRLIRPRPAKEITPNTRVDAGDVAETEALIGFVAACRNYASELAINEITQRVFKELQQFLESGTRTLLDGLRGASPSEVSSASPRSMRRCGFAPRCSAKKMRHCSPRRPKSPRTTTNARPPAAKA